MLERRGGLNRQLRRVRVDSRATLLWSLRITVAATASYVVALLFFPGTQPLLAPLTAMLVVQVTPVSLLASGLDRVVAVVAGVSLAVGFAAVVPLEWWSLGLLIFVSITLGQLLRLRANLVEVAISGMLVLGVGSFSAGSAAWQRIAETLVGAAVGIAANLLFPPKVGSDDAGRAIDGLADAVSQLLSEAADELDELDDEHASPPANVWLDEARTINHDIPQVGAALLHAEAGRRLNVRAVGTPNVGPGLRQGLEALEHMAVSIRGMFRAVVDADHDQPEGLAESWPAYAQTFREMARGVDAFGQLVRSEADASTRLTRDDVDSVQAAREGLYEARARLEDAMLGQADPALLELNAVVLSTVKRLLTEMDLDQRIRRQLQILPVGGGRLAPSPVPRRRRGRRPPPVLEPMPDAETQVLQQVRDEPDGADES